MKLRDIAYNARIELLEPMVGRPSRRYLLQLVTTVCQSYFNEISASGRSWSVCDNPLILTVRAGVGEYPLSVGDEFGRPLDVFTFNAGDPSFNEQPVDFFELGDQHFDQGGPRNAARDSAGHTAQRISFFKKGFQNNTFASISPIPQSASQFKILYSLGEMASQMALDDSPLMAHHHNMLVVKTALDALPACAWFASEQDNRLRRNELRESFMARLPPLVTDFRRYIRSVTQPRMSFRAVSSID